MSSNKNLIIEMRFGNGGQKEKARPLLVLSYIEEKVDRAS